MTWEIATLLGIILIALVLFWKEWTSPDVVAIGILLALTFTGLLPKNKVFAGFSNDAVIMILWLLIMSTALERTGVIDIAGRAVLRRTGDNAQVVLAVIMLGAALIGAFMSNTASTAFFVPIVVGVARKSGISPSKLLMPLAFASILSSSVTLISTSTNLVVSGMMSHYGMKPIGMFEMTPVGIPITLAGLLYMFFIGRWLIPDRVSSQELTDQFGVRPFLSEIVIQPGSSLANKTLDAAKVGRSLGLTVLRIVRDKNLFLPPRGDTILKVGDVLLVEGLRDDLLKIKDIAGVEIKADARLSDPDLQAGEMALVEAIILPGSTLIGRTLKNYRFRERTGLQVIGLNHHGRNVVEKISQVPLRLGSAILVQGREEQLRRAHEEKVFTLLSPIELMQGRRARVTHAPIAVGIFLLAIALPTFGLLSFPIAAMLGVLLVFATGCITPEQAYNRVEWKAVILIACMLGLGTAMEATGAAKYLAALLVQASHGTDPIWLLSAFFALTVLLTQPMSNQAAAIVILPVALQAAYQTGANPRTFAMMVTVAASCSFLTPLEPSCLMVFGPGRYKFRDFLKVGSLLTVVIYLISISLVPKVWPLKDFTPDAVGAALLSAPAPEPETPAPDKKGESGF